MLFLTLQTRIKKKILLSELFTESFINSSNIQILFDGINKMLN